MNNLLVKLQDANRLGSFSEVILHWLILEVILFNSNKVLVIFLVLDQLIMDNTLIVLIIVISGLLRLILLLVEVGEDACGSNGQRAESN